MFRGEPAGEVPVIAFEYRCEIRQDEVGPLGHHHVEAGALEGRGQEVSAGGVFTLELGEVLPCVIPEGVGHGGLEGRGDGVVQELVGGLCAVHKLPRTGGPPDLPPREGVGLSSAGQGEGALPHAGKTGKGQVHGVVEDQVLVHLVGEDDQVVLDAHSCDDLQLLPGEDLPRGVHRGVQDDHPGALVQQRPKRVFVQGEVGGAKRDKPGCGARQGQAGWVAVVEGLEEDDFITGIEDSQQRRGYPFGGSIEHHHLIHGIVLQPVEALLGFGDGLDQGGMAP